MKTKIKRLIVLFMLSGALVTMLFALFGSGDEPPTRASLKTFAPPGTPGITWAAKAITSTASSGLKKRKTAPSAAASDARSYAARRVCASRSFAFRIPWRTSRILGGRLASARVGVEVGIVRVGLIGIA